jgi:3-phosphoglycerate kinase
MSFKTLDDLPADLTGEVALVRVDLNLPMKDGSATDVTRVEAVKPTILELAGRGAKVLLLAHFGRPGGAPPLPATADRPQFRATAACVVDTGAGSPVPVAG